MNTGTYRGGEWLERMCALAQPRWNDQAWIEQKNGILVRRVVGHRRLEGPQQLERLCQLYAAQRLFTNI